MSFQTALSAGSLTALRSATFAANQYLCLWSNPIVWKTTLTANTSGDSYASVTFGATISGDSADIELGMRVIIGPNDDLQDAIARARANNGGFDGRVRKAISGSTLFINETSAVLNSGDTLWVIQDWIPHQKLARVTGGSSYFKDYDLTFAQLSPVIGDLPTAVAGVVNASDDFVKALTPTALAATDGTAISTWAWTVPTGVVITTGSSSTQNITITCDPGQYAVRLVVTDSGGRTATRWLYVFAVPADLSSVVALGFDGASITRDVDNGDDVTVSAFAGIDTVLDNTLCCIFDVAYYAGAETVVDSNMRFVGRLRTEENTTRSDDTFSLLLETRFEIEGAGAQLSRLDGPSLTLEHDTSPTAWDEIDKATWWRAIAHVLDRHTTYLLTHSLTFSDTSDTFMLPLWGVNDSDMLSECNQLAESIGAALEFAPDGRVQINRRATQLDTSGRDALPTIMALDNRDFIELTIERDHVQTTGLVKADGGVMNTSNNKVRAYISQAPGLAEGPGLERATFNGQVLTANANKAAAEAELNTRAGHYFAEENPTDTITVVMPDGYRFLIPSRHQWYTWTLTAADTNLRDVSYTTATRWLCIAVSLNHDHATGAGSVEATFRRETTGEGAISIDPPAVTISNPIINIPPDIGIPELGDLLPFDPIIDIGDLPPFWGDTPGELPTDGNAVIVGTDAGIWYTLNFLSTPLDGIEITPALESGHSNRHGAFGLTTEYYLLTSDGETSYVYYSPNPFTPGGDWTQSDAISGEYTQIKPTSTAGAVYLYGATAGGVATDYDDDYWISQPYPFSFTWPESNPADPPFHSVDLDQYAGGVAALVDYNYNYIGGNALHFNDTETGSILDSSAALSAGVNKAHFTDSPGGIEPDPTCVALGYTLTGNLNEANVTGGSPPIFAIGFAGGVLASTVTGEVRILVAKATQAFPGGAGDTAQTVYSDDFGATWAAPAVIGDGPGAFGGLDAIPIGADIYGASTGQVSVATSGGVYAAYGDPLPTGGEPNTLVVPRYQLGSVSVSNANATPEYVVASADLTASDAAVWEVTATGTVFDDITPEIGIEFGVAVGPYCLSVPWRSALRCAALLSFGGTIHLVTKINLGSASLTWTDRGAVTNDATFVTYRKGDLTLNQLYFVDGQPQYSPNHGATIYERPFPFDETTTPAIFICPFG